MHVFSSATAAHPHLVASLQQDPDTDQRLVRLRRADLEAMPTDDLLDELVTLTEVGERLDVNYGLREHCFALADDVHDILAARRVLGDPLLAYS